MRLNDLHPAPGSTHARKRLGRGTGSGHGGTSTRGVKGQKARTSGGVRPGFEGGQMPLARRMPKRGFTNIFKKEFVILNLSRLNRFEDGTVVTPESLREAGLIKKKGPVKILGSGELKKALTVKAHAFSQKAMAKIVAAGGKAEVV